MGALLPPHSWGRRPHDVAADRRRGHWDGILARAVNGYIYFSGDIGCHFFIADASGKSVIVKYWDDTLQVVPVKGNYQVASNSIAFRDLNIGEGFTEFERYDTVQQRIEQNNQVLTEEQAIDLLAEIGIYGPDGEDKLEWSVIYHFSGCASVFTGASVASTTTSKKIDFFIDKPYCLTIIQNIVKQ